MARVKKAANKSTKRFWKMELGGGDATRRCGGYSFRKRSQNMIGCLIAPNERYRLDDLF
jgi:hypothetical protein